MEEFDVISVRQLIDTGFGETCTCPIDFKKFEAVLYILARQLDVLQRQFKIEVVDKRRLLGLANAATYAVKEIKIHTKGKTGGRRRSVSGRRRLSSKDYSQIFPMERLAGEYDDKMSSSERRKAGKYDEEISPGEKRRARKYGDDMSPSERRRAGKYDNDMSPSQRRRAGKYDDDMSPSERRRAGKYDDEMSPSERRRAGKYDNDMSPSERRRAGKYDDEMSPSERRRAGKYVDESPAKRQKAGKFADQKSHKTEKYTDDMSPSDRGGKYFTTNERRSNESVLMGKSTSKKYRAQKTGADGGTQKKGAKYDALDFYEDKNLEEQHEKIYIVTRTSSGREIRHLKSDLQPVVVTLEQFMGIIEETRALQTKFGITNMIPADFNDLRQPTSMTDPKTALNLSVRLDAAEDRLARMMKIFTELASQVPGIDLEAAFAERFLPMSADMNSKKIDLKQPLLETPAATSRGTRTKTQESSRTASNFDTASFDYDIFDEDDEAGITGVTRGQLNSELQKLYDDTRIHIDKATDYVFKNIRGLDVDLLRSESKINKINKSLQDVHKVQQNIAKFGDRVVEIDQRLTTKTFLYQDNITRMGNDLESALEELYEALSSPQDDPAAVAQITAAFKNYQIDLNLTANMQVELKRELNHFSTSLKKIKGVIEFLWKIKSTRDEMVEALSEKLSLKDINGYLSQEQFAALYADFDKILRNVGDRLYSKECDWQKMIDELYATTRACADIYQLGSLAESVRVSFECMNRNVNDMLDIVGAPKTSPTNKKLDCEGNCLSCGSPAKVVLSETDIVRWKEMITKGVAFEYAQIKEKVEAPCVAGYRVPHPLGQNSFVCEHDCGDSVYTNNSFGLIITELNPAEASSIETRKETLFDSHKKWCSCANCADMK